MGSILIESCLIFSYFFVNFFVSIFHFLMTCNQLLTITHINCSIRWCESIKLIWAFHISITLNQLLCIMSWNQRLYITCINSILWDDISVSGLCEVIFIYVMITRINSIISDDVSVSGLYEVFIYSCHEINNYSLLVWIASYRMM